MGPLDARTCLDSPQKPFTGPQRTPCYALVASMYLDIARSEYLLSDPCATEPRSREEVTNGRVNGFEPDHARAVVFHVRSGLELALQEGIVVIQTCNSKATIFGRLS